MQQLRVFGLILTPVLTINRKKRIQMASLGADGGMHVAVERNFYIRMPQYLADAFYICSIVNTICCEGMAQYMKIGILKARLL